MYLTKPVIKSTILQSFLQLGYFSWPRHDTTTITGMWSEILWNAICIPPTLAMPSSFFLLCQEYCVWFISWNALYYKYATQTITNQQHWYVNVCYWWVYLKCKQACAKEFLMLYVKEMGYLLKKNCTKHIKHF